MATIADIYQSQLGRTPDTEGAAYWQNQLDSGVLSLAQIEQAINSSLEGQNYDTQAVTSGYRDSFARNPEQDGYQYWVSAMQSDPTRGSNWIGDALRAGAQGTDTQGGSRASVDVSALEADPYAGRYATRSIYDLIPDAVNVSNINGRDAQFVTPVGQIPVISRYNNGAFTSTPGQYTVNPAQAYAQIGTALDSGALSAEQYLQMMDSLGTADSVSGLRDAFNKPKATVNLGKRGAQTGVNGRNVNFNPIIANNYAGVDTGTTSQHVMTDQNLAEKLPGLVSTIDNQLQKVNPKFETVSSSKFRNLGAFGANQGEAMGAGNANYQSDLIRSLRNTGGPNRFNNTGVNLWDVDTTNTLQAIGPSGYGGNMAFNPQVFNQTPATAEEVANRNAYETYRNGMVGKKTPTLSFNDWMAQRGSLNNIKAPGDFEFLGGSSRSSWKPPTDTTTKETSGLDPSTLINMYQNVPTWGDKA